MANYQKILQLRPEMADFYGKRDLIGYRGDVLSYIANIRCEAFSTDAAGFRHSKLGDKEYSVADCIKSDRYGIVLGASNTFGFGVVGNENSLASLLADRFGFPFANAAMPGGNSRNLYALLVGFIARGKQPPEIVVHSSGGELANFCESGFVDPVFGSPNHIRLKSLKERGVTADAEKNFPGLLAFNALWTTTIASTCRAHRSGLVLIHQSTFFEKAKPSKTERAFELGEPFRPSQAVRFANHRTFDGRFYARRKVIADKLNVPLAGWGLNRELSFQDEFHADTEGTRQIAHAVGDEVEMLLSTETSARGAVKKTRAPTSA